jgi:hypothetical protein
VQSQFVLLFTQTMLNAWSPCEFPKIFSYAVAIYTLSILILFLNFYYKAYILKTPRAGAVPAQKKDE